MAFSIHNSIPLGKLLIHLIFFSVTVDTNQLKLFDPADTHFSHNYAPSHCNCYACQFSDDSLVNEDIVNGSKLPERGQNLIRHSLNIQLECAIHQMYVAWEKCISDSVEDMSSDECKVCGNRGDLIICDGFVHINCYCLVLVPFNIYLYL